MPKSRTERNDELLSGLLYRLAEKSYQTEVMREKMLEDLSVQLLTCMTILSVALITPASFLFECYSDGTGDLSTGQIRLAWMYALVLIPQVIGMLLVLRARVLKTINTLASPVAQADFIDSTLNDYEQQHKAASSLEMARCYCTGLEDSFKGMAKKHDEMWKLLKISMFLLGLSAAFSALFGLYLLLSLS